MLGERKGKFNITKGIPNKKMKKTILILSMIVLLSFSVLSLNCPDGKSVYGEKGQEYCDWTSVSSCSDTQKYDKKDNSCSEDVKQTASKLGFNKDSSTYLKSNWYNGTNGEKYYFTLENGKYKEKKVKIHKNVVKETSNVKIEWIGDVESEDNVNDMKNKFLDNKNKIELNADYDSELHQTSAWVTMYDTDLVNPKIFHNGKLQKQTIIFNEGKGTFKFLAHKFSVWELADTFNGTMTNITIRNSNLEKESDYKMFTKHPVSEEGEVTDSSIEVNNLTIFDSPIYNPASPRVNSVRFNDTGDLAETTTSNGLLFNESDSEVTISMWVKPDDVTKLYQWFFAQSPASTFGDAKASINLHAYDSRVRFSISNDTTNGNQDSVTAPAGSIINDTWTFIVGRMNITHISLFIDGQELASTARTRNPHNKENWKIGGTGIVQSQFLGEIDSLIIRDGAVSSENILDAYETRLNSVYPQPWISVYTFSSATTNSTHLKDVIDSNHLEKSETPESVRGGISSATGSYLFDGTDDYFMVTEPETLQIRGNISAFTWFKMIDVADLGYETLFGQVIEGEAEDTNVLYMLYLTPLGEIGYLHEYDSGSNVLNETIFVLTENEWTHIGFTRDNSTGNVSIYINGNVSLSFLYEPETQSPTGGELTNFLIANNVGYAPDRFVNAEITETIVSPRIYTRSEITDLYSSSTPKEWLYTPTGNYVSLNCSTIDNNVDVIYRMVMNVTIAGTIEDINISGRAGDSKDLSGEPYISAGGLDGNNIANFTFNQVAGNCSEVKIEYVDDPALSDSISDITITSEEVLRKDASGFHQFHPSGRISAGTSQDVVLYYEIGYNSTYNFTTHPEDPINFSDNVRIMNNVDSVSVQDLTDLSFAHNIQFGNEAMNYTTNLLNTGCSVYQINVTLINVISANISTTECVDTISGGTCVTTMNVSNSLGYKLTNYSFYVNSSSLTHWSDRTSIDITWKNLSVENVTALNNYINEGNCVASTDLVQGIEGSDVNSNSSIPKIAMTSDTAETGVSNATYLINESGVYADSLNIGGEMQLVIEYSWTAGVSGTTGSTTGGGGAFAVIGLPVSKVNFSFLPSNVNQFFVKLPFGKSEMRTNIESQPVADVCSVQENREDLTCTINDNGLITLSFKPTENVLGEMIKTNLVIDGQLLPVRIQYFNLDYYFPTRFTPVDAGVLFTAKDEEGIIQGYKVFPILFIIFMIVMITRRINKKK